MAAEVYDSLMLLVSAALGRDAARALVDALQAGQFANANAVVSNLHTPYGEFLENTLAGQLLAGAATAQDVAAFDTSVFARPPPARVVGRSLVYRLLGLNGMPAEQRRRVADELERAVYNEVINVSMYVTGTMRSWDNPDFVQLYSSRLSTLATNIDPGSVVCQQYGSQLYDRLASGALSAAEAGRMCAEEMCPAAFARENAEIAERSGQRVEEKVSALWTCPVCAARASTYREVQDRASDEPASIYCTCTVCGHHFKAA